MNIGIVLNSSWNVYNFRKGLVKSILREGHEVFIIAPKDEYTPKLIALGCRHIEVEIKSKGANPVVDARLSYALYKIYREVDLDLVLHFTIKPNIFGTYAASWAGIPCINNVTGLGTVFLRNDYRSVIAKWLYRQAFKFPYLVFFQNEDDRSLFLEEKLISTCETELLPGSGIDLGHFIPTSKRDSKQAFTFLMVSRLLYDKGIVEYVDAARTLKEKGMNAKFKVLGKIEEEAGLGVGREIVDSWEKGGLIEYLGVYSDVRPFIEAADCVVLPSYREGTPRSLLEAASMGKPLVATDVPGCREVVNHETNGLLCQMKDAQDLASKMHQIFERPPEQLSIMGKNSRKLVEQKFDERIIAEKYLDAIGKCMEDSISQRAKIPMKLPAFQ